MMCDLFQELLPHINHTCPEGGMFLMATLPSRLTSRRAFEEGICQNIAVLPGMPFYRNGGGTDTIRLNFSSASEDEITEGMHRLARGIAALS